jgi:retron-type reverse transcriptase
MIESESGAKKTVVLHDGQRKAVTGIVVNEKLSVPSEYKKDIRKIMYYCNKYGVIDHMMANKIIGYKSDYLNVLLGKINYVLSVEKNNKQFIEYRSQVKKWLAE